MAHLWPKSLETQILENQKCERPLLKKYVVHLGIARLWEGSERLPGWFRANFPSVKILDFRSAKVFARMVCGKKGPKVLGCPQDEATAWRNGANFPDCTFQPLLRLFSQVGVSIISKRMKNTPEIVQPGVTIISKRMKNTPEIVQPGVYQSSANG